MVFGPAYRRPDSERQHCKVCGHVDKFNFNVPDDLWAAIVPEAFRCRVVCLACFDEFAHAKGVAYAQHLGELWFAGNRAVFLFRPAHAIDC